MENTQKDYLGMIDRYVYDVTRRLPKEQRDDIDLELRGLIEDMLEQNGAIPGKEGVEAVLGELGRPSELAAKYRGQKRFLIGPEMFDVYFLVLKIVMGATALGLTIAIIIGVITTPPQNVFSAIGNYLASLFSAVVQAFAWVTVVFALIERFASKNETWKKDAWKPADLPEIPKAKTHTSAAEAIVGIVFSVIALMLINAVPELIGIYTFSSPIIITPIFDIDVFRSMIILIDIMICLSIVKEAFKLVYGRHTLKLAAAVTAINIASMILVITVFLPPAIWNSELVTSLQATADLSWAAEFDLEYIWSIVPKIIVGLSIFGYVVEIITSIVQGARNIVRK